MAEKNYNFDLFDDEKIPEEIGSVKPLPMDNVKSDGYESIGAKAEKKDDDGIKMTNFNNSPKFEEYRDIRNYAKEDSVGKKEVDYSSQRMKKIGYTATAIIVALGIGIASICSTVHLLQKHNAEKEILGEYQQIVSTYTERAGINSEYFYHKPEKIAKKILDEIKSGDNYDFALYGVYKQIGAGPENKMDKANSVMAWMNEYIKENPEQYGNIPVYEGKMDEYMIKNGFVDKNGNPSQDKYEKEMDKKVLKAYKGSKQDSSAFQFNGDWDNPVVTVEVPSGKTR